MKRTWFTIIAAGMLFTAGCAKQEPLYEEPYEAVEYNLYRAPENAYVADTMPYESDEGELELYYLYNTDHNGQGIIRSGCIPHRIFIRIRIMSWC